MKRFGVLNNKRGNLEDWAQTPLIIFTVIFVLFFTNMFLYKFNDNLQNSDAVNPESKIIVNHIVTSSMEKLDNIVFVIYIILMITVLISAYLVQSNAIFFIIGFLYMMFTIWVMPILTNILVKLFSANTFTSVIASLMPKSYFIVENLTLIQIVFWCLVAIALYSKSTNRGDEQVI